MKTIYLAGGCFWGTQKFFDRFPGVVRTTVGFANGKTENPSYRDVCDRNTGHAETVKIEFDETVLSLEKILNGFFFIIDPFSRNRQGEDVGTQYRTGIYYQDPSLFPIIHNRVKREEIKFNRPLAVEVTKLQNFYPAEEYHQKYLDKNPGGYCHIPLAKMNADPDQL